MNQIKVRAGQVWEGKLNNPKLTSFAKGRKINIGTVSASHVNYEGYCQLPIKAFHAAFNFLPQTELEFLAVKVDNWDSEKPFIRKFLHRHSFCITKHYEKVQYFTRTQWQNMRYYLGLDKKPHYRLIDKEWVKQ